VAIARACAHGRGRKSGNATRVNARSCTKVQIDRTMTVANIRIGQMFVPTGVESRGTEMPSYLDERLRGGKRSTVFALRTGERRPSCAAAGNVTTIHKGDQLSKVVEGKQYHGNRSLSQLQR
jgi:hypothetical protein